MHTEWSDCDAYCNLQGGHVNYRVNFISYYS